MQLRATHAMHETHTLNKQRNATTFKRNKHQMLEHTHPPTSLDVLVLIDFEIFGQVSRVISLGRALKSKILNLNCNLWSGE